MLNENSPSIADDLICSHKNSIYFIIIIKLPFRIIKQMASVIALSKFNKRKVRILERFLLMHWQRATVQHQSALLTHTSDQSVCFCYLISCWSLPFSFAPRKAFISLSLCDGCRLLIFVYGFSLVLANIGEISRLRFHVIYCGFFVCVRIFRRFEWLNYGIFDFELWAVN